MKRLGSAVLFIVWVLAISLVATWFWINRPNYFPAIPASMSAFLARSYGARNAEDIADLEMLIGFAVSIPCVAILTLIVLRLMRRPA